VVEFFRLVWRLPQVMVELAGFACNGWGSN
jgi:hypothetical protein